MKKVLVVPLQPAECSVTTESTTAIRISIRKGSKESDATGYILTYTGEAGDNKVTIRYDGEGPHDELMTGLIPGTNYRFSTVAYTEGGNSTACSDAGQTCKSDILLANRHFC